MVTGSFPAMRAIWTGSLWDFMVCVVGLLITPGPYHRIVEGGEDSGNFHRLVTVIADLALLPVALALGPVLFLQPAVFSGMLQVPALDLQPLLLRSVCGPL